MRWFRRRERKPSEATLVARAETDQARARLEAIKRDDEKLERLTARTQRQVAKNNFAADIRRALGGAQ